jgi:hypothetical protein
LADVQPHLRHGNAALNQINKQNVGRLTQTWTDRWRRCDREHPIVYRGVMYVEVPTQATAWCHGGPRRSTPRAESHLGIRPVGDPSRAKTLAIFKT